MAVGYQKLYLLCVIVGLILAGCMPLKMVTSPDGTAALPSLPATRIATPTPERNIPTVTPTTGVSPSPLSVTPSKTATPLRSTATATPTPTPALEATFTPSPTPIPPTATATPTFTPTPTALPPPPTVEQEGETHPSTYRYLPLGPARPDLSHPCPGCPRAPGYITGRVLDEAGKPLPGVRLVCYNDWHRYPVVGSKGGGEYDFPILQAEATWYVVVLDEADQPLSPPAAVEFNPVEACWYQLDWQRVDTKE